MKKFSGFLIFSAFLLVSCVNNNGPTVSPGSSDDSERVDLTLENKGSFDVNVYINKSPYYDVSPDVTVPAGQSVVKKVLPSTVSTGDVFYLEYLIDIGSSKFPYKNLNNEQCAKELYIAKDKTNTLTIDELTKCESKSAYFLVENNTSSEIYLQNGMNIVSPYGTSGSDSYLIKADGGSAVYEVADDDTPVVLGNLGLLKIVSTLSKYDFPLGNDDVTAGNIYTVTLSTDSSSGTAVTSASLKAVTPFDVDTRKKIWKLENSVHVCEESNKPVVRNASDAGDGYIIMGTKKLSDSDAETTVTLQYLSVYGKYTGGYDMTIRENNLAGVKVIDFAERSDGTIAMLLEFVYLDADGNYLSHHHSVYVYDFKNNKLISSINLDKNLTDSAGNTVRLSWPVEDSKNRIYLSDDQTIAVVGSLNSYSYSDDSEVDRYYDYFGLVTLIFNPETGDYDPAYNFYQSPEYSDFVSNGTTRSLTSVYYNGSEYIACGYTDWDSSYSRLGHKGKIYSINEKTMEATEVYSADRILPFNIAGTSSNYYVCGEYAETTGTLKGVILTSSLIEKEENPVIYNTNVREHCWFNQFCLYGNKIVLCGTASRDKGAQQEPMPVVAAFSTSGKMLWENVSFTDYSGAINIIPNTIGSYLIQLIKNKSDSEKTVWYVSADLLGN